MLCQLVIKKALWLLLASILAASFTDELSEARGGELCG